MVHKVAIIGATGRTGSTVEYVLKNHRYVELVAKTSRGEPGYMQLNIDKSDELDHLLSLEPEIAFITIDGDDAVKKHVEKFRQYSAMRIIDLSTVYRTDKDFVYGLPELPGRRSEIRTARLISNPGCYATSIILATAPLLKEFPDLIDIVTVVGVSSHTGAGKKSENELRAQYEDNILSYATTNHKHKPEISNEFRKLVGRDVRLAFAPSVVWCSPGILNTIYVHTKMELSGKYLSELYSEHYKGERFVRVVDKEPSIKDVRGTNFVDVYPLWDNEAGVVVVRSVIDNLVKGAGGQAVQNMNIMLGLEESEGLLP